MPCWFQPKEWLKAACLISTIIVVTSGMTRAQEPSSDGLTREAIVRVEVRGQTERGPFLRFGTGFFVGKQPIVLTARHLIHPDVPWAKDDVTGQFRFAIYVTIRDASGLLRDRRGAYVVGESELHDVASLRVDGKTSTSGLATCPEPSLSGNPFVFVQGFSAKAGGDSDQIGEDYLDAERGVVLEPRLSDGGRMRFSGATRPGFSGAPVFIEGSAVGIVTGGTDGQLDASPQTLFTPLTLIRGEFLGDCPTPCRHPDHGVERYKQAEEWNADSGWKQGDGTAQEYCESQRIARQRQFPDRMIKLLRFNDDVRWTGVLERFKEHHYQCLFRDEWDPVYREDLTSSCEQTRRFSILPR